MTEIYLIRHGESEWSKTRRHTGLTDVKLTARGEELALALKPRLDKIHFDIVQYSPLIRARRTCELSGQFEQAQCNPDLVEWNYGDYEGLTTEEIRHKQPHWLLFHDGVPNGETFADIEQRAKRVLDPFRHSGKTVALFSSAHILRSIAAVWLGLHVEFGKHLFLQTASVSILGYERQMQVIKLWNG